MKGDFDGMIGVSLPLPGLSDDVETTVMPPVVVLPAGEAMLLTRIAEVAAEYGRTRRLALRGELFRLAEEWRIEWRNKRNM